MRPAKFLAVALMTLLLPAGAHAWSTQGGRTLDPGRYAIEVAAGFPTARLAVHVPLQKHLEVGPFLGFHYFGDVTDRDVRLANTLGARIKLNVVDRGAFQMALLAQPALMIEYDPDIRVGIQISLPEVILGYDILANLQVFGGIRFPIAFLFDTDYRVRVRLPLLGQVGVEWGVTSKITLFFTAEAGPAWEFGAKVPKCTPAATGQNRQVCNYNDTTGGNTLDVFLSGLIGVTFGW